MGSPTKEDRRSGRDCGGGSRNSKHAEPAHGSHGKDTPKHTCLAHTSGTLSNSYLSPLLSSASSSLCIPASTFSSSNLLPTS